MTWQRLKQRKLSRGEVDLNVLWHVWCLLANICSASRRKYLECNGNDGVKSHNSPGSHIPHPKEYITLNALCLLVTKESKQSSSQALSVRVLEPVVKTIHWITI